MDYRTELAALFDTVVEEGASDIHFSAGLNPIIRVSGTLIPLLKAPKLTAEDTLNIVKTLLTPEQVEEFLGTKEIDFSYAYKQGVRFRGNGYFQQGTVSVALRLIPNQVKTFSDLGLPPILETFCNLPQGFFLCVGPVGQGKSTTLASMVERINQSKPVKIVTIEDPIEYLFSPKKAIIEQREVRVDTRNFRTALHAAFREDINVLMVGEMRGPETISAAVTAAETGHLILSTLHTNNAAQTIDRIIDSFPPGQQDQIRIQLAGSLAGIFSQRLVPRIAGGLIPAYEVMINTPAVSNLIRERRTHELNTVIETGSEQGMVDMNRSLVELVQRGEITVENAYARTSNPKGLERLL